MLKPLYWRIYFFLKKRQSKLINKRLGKHVKAVIVDSANGILATDPRDLEVGLKLRKHGSYGLAEISRISKLISPKSNVLIIGAHIGSLAIPISKKCSKLIAIEANPDNFKLLETNIQLKYLKVQPSVFKNYGFGQDVSKMRKGKKNPRDLTIILNL